MTLGIHNSGKSFFSSSDHHNKVEYRLMRSEVFGFPEVNSVSFQVDYDCPVGQRHLPRKMKKMIRCKMGYFCDEHGCDKKNQGGGKCVAHGGGKRCSEPGCPSSAVGKTDKCKAHGGGKRCSEPGCPSSAREKSDKCVAHGGGKRCSEPGCPSSAQGKTDKCKAHGGGKRCPSCIDHIDSRSANPKYDGYCATCFKHLFPSDPRTLATRSHTKELLVRKAINERFGGFIHDQVMYIPSCSCEHRRRVDHRKLIKNTMLAIESDEFGHRGYDRIDEIIRYDDLYMIST